MLRGTRQTPPANTPLGKAIETCRPCGLTADDVTWLIDSVSAAELTRDECLNLFRDQFEDPAKADLCEPCATAILNAAPNKPVRRPS